MARTRLKTRTVGVTRGKRAKQAERRPETDEDLENNGADAPEHEESSQGGTRLDRCFSEIDSGRRLLTGNEELSIARSMMMSVVADVIKKLEHSRRLVHRSNVSAETKAKAASYLKEFNPHKLKDERLEDYLIDRFYKGAEGGMEDYKELIKSNKEASAFMRHLIEANLRLVISIAKRYPQRMIKLPDLIQEGNLGLIHAATRFDYRRGNRFSTYATWWIRHAIGRAIADKGREIRLPVHLIELHGQVEKARRQLSTNGQPVSDEAIARQLGVPLEKVRRLATDFAHPTSLDHPVQSDGPEELHDLVSATTEDKDPWTAIVEGRTSELLRKAFRALSPIERDVLEKRFDLDGDGDQERTFKDIGDTYRLSRERIRQIQNNALGKLRRILSRQLGH